MRSLAPTVNHSDLEIRPGNWRIHRADPFPHIPGLEVVGEAVQTGSAVSEFRVGDRIITMMACPKRSEGASTAFGRNGPEVTPSRLPCRLPQPRPFLLIWMLTL